MISACTSASKDMVWTGDARALGRTSTDDALIAERVSLVHVAGSIRGSTAMKLYRVNKLTRPDGVIVKKKHILAVSDKQAVQDARESDDCPVCDVVRDDGTKVGQIHT